MEHIGPPLPAVLHRLAETPADFLDEPRIGSRGTVAVAALLSDVLDAIGIPAGSDLLQRYLPDRAETQDRNLYQLAMIIAWLLADEWLEQKGLTQGRVSELLTETLPELAAQVRADRYIADPDRREELARTFLARLNFRPEGESVAEATDRLTRISATERRRLLEASRAAEQRAREIREALARKAAQESADKWTRE